jgi:RNA polymerase sigma-70 factor (ECF subfamily)
MDSERQRQFAEYFVLHQARVYGYIVTMLPNRHDAEDVFSNTSLILWEKWDQFDARRDFAAWACGIARNEVHNFLRTRAHDHVSLSEKMLDELADVRLQSQPLLNRRRLKLADCMKKLDFICREMLERSYAAGASIKAIAKQFRLTPNALSLRLRRLRREMLECVERGMNEDADEDASGDHDEELSAEEGSS